MTCSVSAASPLPPPPFLVATLSQQQRPSKAVTPNPLDLVDTISQHQHSPKEALNLGVSPAHQSTHNSCDWTLHNLSRLNQEDRKLTDPLLIVVNYKLALAIGTCHLPLQGLNHVLLQLLIFNTP